MRFKPPGNVPLRTIQRWLGAGVLAALAFMVLFVVLLGLLAWKTGAFDPGWRVGQIHISSFRRDVGGMAE
jgi:hypothetical protein